MKTIDLRWTIGTICSTYPETIDLFVGLGFRELSNPLMRATVGNVMSIPKGAIMRQIPIERIRQTLLDNGFEVIES